MTLTLNLIKSHDPCKGGYATLLQSLNKTEADDEPLCLGHLLESNGVKDTLWVIFKCVEGREMDKRNLLADIVESVEYIWNEAYPEDRCVREVIEGFRDERIGKNELIELKDKVVDAATVGADFAYATAYAVAINAANAVINTANTAIYAVIYAIYAANAANAANAAHAKGTEKEAEKAKQEEKEKQEGMIQKWFGDLFLM